MIITLTEIIIVNIERAIIYEALNINKYIKKRNNILLYNFIILTINKVSIIFLKSQFMIDFELNQIKKKIKL